MLRCGDAAFGIEQEPQPVVQRGGRWSRPDVMVTLRGEAGCGAVRTASPIVGILAMSAIGRRFGRDAPGARENILCTAPAVVGT